MTALRIVVLLALITLVTRMGEFFNPLTHKDEQFYLFVGKAMLHGELPYFDIWDRKPIGLFLIYEGIAALGGNSVLLYHVVASVAALATSLVIVRLGEQVAGRAGGIRAGIVYLFLLPAMSGAGGQAPVFYNLPIAASAWLAFDAFVRKREAWPRAFAAMALCGLSIQIKPTCVFEGAFFGLLFLGAEWNATRGAWRVTRLAAGMIAIALLPTIAIFATYAWLGHLHDIWTATVVSIFTKAPLRWSDRTGQMLKFVIVLGIPIVAAAISLIPRFGRDGLEEQNVFLGGWLVAALAGYLSVPNFFDHYALPLMVPLSIALASLLQGKNGIAWLAAVVAPPVLFSTSLTQTFSGRPDFDRLAAYVSTHLNGGCLYVYNGPTALYTATNACHLSPFVFPDHLELAVESHALPVSPTAEVERIFARRPTVVVTTPRTILARNNATAAIVERHLSCDYRLLRAFPTIGGRDVSVWLLRPGGPHVCPATHPPLGIVQDSP